MATGVSGFGGTMYATRAGAQAGVLQPAGYNRTKIADLKKWSITIKAQVHDYRSNSTNGYTNRVSGSLDGSGSVEGAWRTGAGQFAYLLPGTTVLLELYIRSAAIGGDGLANTAWVVTAIIDDFKQECDIDSGAVVGWSASFSTDGSMTAPTI